MYYSKAEREAGYWKKNFIQAKYDFVDEMMKFAGLKVEDKPAKILDVGCGIGGTSRYLLEILVPFFFTHYYYCRYLASKFGSDSKVMGITLSPEQVKRATQLAKEKNIDNAEFVVMDALKMDFPDNTFDVVWACESGEHMPDKAR